MDLDEIKLKIETSTGKPVHIGTHVYV
jgi:hypothetical protein